MKGISAFAQILGNVWQGLKNFEILDFGFSWVDFQIGLFVIGITIALYKTFTSGSFLDFKSSRNKKVTGDKQYDSARGGASREVK